MIEYDLPKMYNIYDRKFWLFFELQIVEMLIRFNSIEDDGFEYYLQTCWGLFDKHHNIEKIEEGLRKRFRLASNYYDNPGFHESPKHAIMMMLINFMYSYQNWYICFQSSYFSLLSEAMGLPARNDKYPAWKLSIRGRKKRIKEYEKKYGISQNEMDDIVSGCWEMYCSCVGIKKNISKSNTIIPPYNFNENIHIT